MLTDLDLSIQAEAGETFILRRATADDLDQIVALLTDDPINATRGDGAPATSRVAYERSFDSIMLNDSNDIVVAVNSDESVLGTLQLTRVPGMVRGGATRLMVEAMFVARAARCRGVGTFLMHWVLDTAAPSVGADLVQLTSDATRGDAHRFYERLGFAASHLGFKLDLAERTR